MLIYSSCQAQVALVMSKKIEITAKYSDFSDVFSSDSMVELSKHTRIHDHPTNLLDDKQSLYGLIYSLEPVELETLKNYIKANSTSDFIRSSKSPASVLILFIQKKDSSLCLCINYLGLNNLTIKNCYLLPLISELLDCLGRTKHSTQLNLTNTYY